MSADIFGYERNVNTKSILSHENVIVDFGQGKTALLQQATLQYGHKVSEVLETGSADLYFVNGAATGALECSSVVGRKGFFDGFQLGTQACGDLSTVSITASDTNNCGFSIEKNNALRLESVLLEGISIAIAVNQMVVSQTAKFKVGKVVVTSSTPNNQLS